MDPNLFHLDWDRTLEVLAAVVVLSMVLERALAPLFENRWWLARFDKTISKELLAFALAVGVCVYWQFDAVSMIVLRGKVSNFGEIVTAGVIAGGSKGSIKLFRDVLGFKSSAYREKQGGKQGDNGGAKKP